MKRAILGCVLAVASSAALAAPALVINDEGCALFDGNNQLVFTTDTHRVATQSANGNTVMRCNADVARPNAGQAVRYDFNSTGLLCGLMTATGFEVTDDWDAVVSASGQARLTCRDRD